MVMVVVLVAFAGCTCDPECPTPGLGEVKAFARDVERATQQLKELRPSGRYRKITSLGF